MSSVISINSFWDHIQCQIIYYLWYPFFKFNSSIMKCIKGPIIFSEHVCTGEHQPYAAGLICGHLPAEVSRFNNTFFFRGSNLLTVAGEPSVAFPANLGRWTTTFRSLSHFGDKNGNLSSERPLLWFWPLCQNFTNHKHANLGRWMATFRICELHLLTSTGEWPLFGD